MPAQIITKWIVQMMGFENGSLVFNIHQEHDSPVPSPNRGDYFTLLGRMGRVLDVIHSIRNTASGVEYIMNVRVDPMPNIPAPNPI